jgi:hypothetical protein
VAKIVEPAKPKRVTCKECSAVIEYLPEEVETHSGTYMCEPSGESFVKCPREGCPGRGVISSW